VKNDILAGFTLTWAGECSAWECDELGHMNMRHYVHKTDEARRGLIIRLGLNRAFHPGVVSTIRCRDFHIKYQGEARPFPWPERVRNAAMDFTVSLPPPAKARNINAEMAHCGMSLSELETAGAAIIGAGTFGASEIDITNNVTMGSFFGRTTSTVAWFEDGWPEFADPSYHEGGMSAALLEMRAVIHNYPKNGDAYVYLPAIVGANKYTREFVHNVVDPVSGKSWCSMQASGCKFDLNTRKLVKTTDEEIANMKQVMRPKITA